MVLDGYQHIARSIVVLLACLVLLLQDLLNLSVTEAAVASCYCVYYLVVLHLGLLVHLKDNAEGQFVLIGT